jgi:hypothetical protein
MAETLVRGQSESIFDMILWEYLHSKKIEQERPLSLGEPQLSHPYNTTTYAYLRLFHQGVISTKLVPNNHLDSMPSNGSNQYSPRTGGGSPRSYELIQHFEGHNKGASHLVFTKNLYI